MDDGLRQRLKAFDREQRRKHARDLLPYAAAILAAALAWSLFSHWTQAARIERACWAALALYNRPDPEPNNPDWKPLRKLCPGFDFGG